MEGEVIEAGPFGTAYNITDKETGIERTCKIFKMDGVDEYVAPLRWAKEANNLLKFSGDPHFFQLVDKYFEPDKKSLALVLEKVDGINLETYIMRKGLEKVHEDVIWQIFTQVVRGMCRAN
jgi:serine/threonine protein kinase